MLSVYILNTVRRMVYGKLHTVEAGFTISVTAHPPRQHNGTTALRLWGHELPQIETDEQAR